MLKKHGKLIWVISLRLNVSNNSNFKLLLNLSERIEYITPVQYEEKLSHKIPDIIMLDMEGLPAQMLSKIKDKIDVIAFKAGQVSPPILAILAILGNYYLEKQKIYLHRNRIDKKNSTQVTMTQKSGSPSLFSPYTQVKKTNHEYHVLAEKTEKYLVNHLANDITLNMLACKMATNRNKLTKAFKAYFGTTVIKWLREKRMLKAQELLRNSNISTLEIAYQVGYNNPANFSTAYRQIFSKSPREERQIVLN